MHTTKFYTMSVQATNRFISNLRADETLLIINVGQAQTEMNECSENIIEIKAMLLDIPQNRRADIAKIERFTTMEIDPLRKQKFYLISNLFKTGFVYSFTSVIVRCDAGMSRSQAISTALSRKYGIDFIGNEHIGEWDILKQFEEFLEIKQTEEDYQKLFDEDIKKKNERVEELRKLGFID